MEEKQNPSPQLNPFNMQYIIWVVITALFCKLSYEYGTGYSTRQKEKAAKKHFESLPKAVRK